MTNATYPIGINITLANNQTVEVIGYDDEKFRVRDKDGGEKVVAAEDIRGVANPIAIATMDFKHIALEVLANTTHFALLQKVQGHDFMKNKRTIGFGIADIVYELVGKSYFEPWLANMTGLPMYINASDDSFVQSSDFMEALKALPIAVLHGLVQKLMQKKSFGSDFMRNLVEGYIAVAVANVDMRLIQGWASGKEKEYRY